MMKETFLLDVDGVLADFCSAALRVGNRLAGTAFTAEDVRQWDIFAEPQLKAIEAQAWREIEAPEFAYRLDVYPGAIEFVRELRRRGFDLFVVTSPLHSPTFHYDRCRWLYEHFDIHRDRVILAKAKHMVRGDWLLDDKPENVIEWVRANHGKGILLDAPWNRWKSMERAFGFEGVLSAARPRGWPANG